MAFEYTASQQAAIDTRGHNLLVSAAAGAGKTQVLIDRIVSLVVDDEVPLHDMVVVTFTNAAAGEMKERLQQGLSQAILTHPTKRAFLYDQLRALPGAHVSTLHAYCIQTMRTYYHVVDLEPDFRVLNDATGVILRERAMQEAMEAGYESDDEAFDRLIDAYGGRNDDRQVVKMVQDLARFLLSVPDADAWLQRVSEHYNINQSDELNTHDPFVSVLGAQLREEINAVAALLVEADRFLPFEGEGLTAGYRDTLAADEELVEEWYETIHSAQTIDDLAPLQVKPTFKTLKSISDKKLDANELLIKERFKTLRNTYKKRLGELHKVIPPNGGEGILRDRQAIYPVLLSLIELTKSYLERYAALKRKRNEVDYNDLETFMLRILENEEARAGITHSLRYVFFDEYQDCNAVQEAIINRLAPADGLFHVGDVKQAIYGFRYADPQLFHARFSRYASGIGGEVIHLAENFRSVPGILAFCNALFMNLMRTDLGDIDYAMEGQAFVVPQTGRDPEAVQFIALESDGKMEERQEAQAMWIAEEIRRNVTAGTWRYSDVAVLMRAPGARLAAYEKAFKLKGVPFFSDNAAITFDNMEVRLFLNMLQVLHNDRLDTPLAAVLLSPFGDLNDADLAAIRLAYPDESMAEACRQYDTSKNERVGAKLATFYSALANWRKRLQKEPLTDVVNALFQESGYAAFLLSLEEGAERTENVQAFISRIAEFDADADTGLQGFLQYAEVLQARKGDSLTPGISLSADENRVQIMSIHKSKGLGFPVVFVADLSRGFSARDASNPLVLHRDLGVAMNVVDLEKGTFHKTFERAMMKKQFENENRSEEVRLLYVAMTRAKKQLYLVTSEKDIDEKIDKKNAGLSADATKHGSSYQDWFFTYMGLPPEESALSLAHQGTPQAVFTFHKVDGEEILADIAASDVQVIELDTFTLPTEVTARVADRLGYAYPYQAETVLPLKTTVTQLADAARSRDAAVWVPHSGGYSESLEVTTPLFLQEDIHLTAAETGTVLHRVMQLLPLQPMSPDEIADAIRHLADRELISTAQWEAVVKDSLITAFFESDLGKQILRHSDRVEREVSFTMRKDGYIVDGQIDLIYSDGENWHIVDFKSDRTIQPERYHVQMALYREALEKARVIHVDSVHLFWLRHGVASRVV